MCFLLLSYALASLVVLFGGNRYQYRLPVQIHHDDDEKKRKTSFQDLHAPEIIVGERPPEGQLYRTVPYDGTVVPLYPITRFCMTTVL